MTNMKTTKKALIFSALSLLLCFSMLVGTTFAWFTDSVTSSGNIIKSGTLEVALEWADGTEALDKANWADASAGKIFENDKWEPGYTEARHLKISNKGTLALKYELAIIPNGTVSALADVIDVYYIEDGAQVADRTALKDMTPVGTLRDLINGGICAGSLEENGAKIITLVLKMQETAGNEYQNLSIGTDFAIQLLATQMTYEDDSFDNQYDANAPYSFWDGTVPAEMPASLVVDGATQTIHVKDAAAFAYLSTLSAKWVELYTDGNGRDFLNYANGAGGDFYYSNKWTVSLEADIDLGNYPIAPVDVKIGESTGASAFNGNGHTIRNINTTTGLFADKARTSFANIILENVKATNGALIGSADHNITGITVKNATISGVDYVGGIVGYIYGGVNDCKVIDSSVVATGKEAGGLIGYIATSNNEAHVANNIVNNVSVYAGNRAAGLIAQVNVNVKVHNNTIDTVTVGAADTTTYQSNAVVSNALDAANVYDNTVKNANVANKAAVADDSAELKSAIADGADLVYLNSGDYTLPSLSGKTGVSIVGADDGSTKLNAVNSFNFGEDTVIKNVTFKTSGSNSVRYGITSGDVVYENCVFEGKQYGYHVDNANDGTITFNNCTFYGRNALASNGTYAFNDCTFKYTYSNYNTTNIYSEATFNNCYWDSKGISLLELYIEDGAKAIIDGEEITERVVFIADARALEKFQQNVNWSGKTYAGVTVMLSADIDMNDAYYKNWTPIGQTGATQFQGTFDGHGYTIKNLNVDASKQTGANYSSGLFGWLNKATVKNLTIDTATVTGNHNVGVIAGYMETAGCTISNCHVINATVVAKHANDDACGDKVGVIVGHAGNAGVKVENCSAKDSTVVAGRDAGQIVGAALTANVTGCTATNVTVTAGGDCTGANVKNEVIGRVLG